MLPRASTATTIDRATRLHARRARLEKFDHFGSRKSSTLIHHANAHPITRGRKGYEDRQSTFSSRNAIALRRESIDRKLQRCLIRNRALRSVAASPPVTRLPLQCADSSWFRSAPEPDRGSAGTNSITIDWSSSVRADRTRSAKPYFLARTLPTRFRRGPSLTRRAV